MPDPFGQEPIDEPSRLRIEWMRLLGHGGQAIDASLRNDRPQSATKEAYLVESVKRLLAVEEYL